MLSEFVNQNAITKTLRFRLLPVGKTQEHIDKKELFKNDFIRDKNYPLLKETADDFYRYYLREQLDDLSLDWVDLAQAYDSILNQDSRGDTLLKVTSEYRKTLLQIIKGDLGKNGIKLTNDEKEDNLFQFGDLFKAKFIKIILPAFIDRNYVSIEAEKRVEAINSYSNFTTRLTNFWEARKNVFTDDAISTSATYRLVNDNFPIHFDNIQKYNSSKDYILDGLQDLENNLKHYNMLRDKESIDDFFEVNAFNRYCTQSGIDLYNAIRGGFVTEDGTKVQGINELLNLKQQELNRGKEQRIKLAQLIRFKKQILEYSESTSFLIDQIDNDADLQQRIQHFQEYIVTESDGEDSLVAKIDSFYDYLQSSNREQIWIDAKKLSNISNLLCGQWDVIKRGFTALKDMTPTSDLLNRILILEKLNEDSKRSKTVYFNLAEISEAIKHSPISLNGGGHFDFIDYLLEQKLEVIKNNLGKYEEVMRSLEKHDSILGNSQNIEVIKDYLDFHLKEYHKLELLKIDFTDLELELDDFIYPILQTILTDYSAIIKLYNMARNYLTRKPSNKEKIKINFDFPTLANGWSENKVKDNHCIILRKGSNYYLGIIDKAKTYKRLVEEKNSNMENGDSSYERMVYSFWSEASRMIPKCSISLKEVKSHFRKDQQSSYIVNKGFMKPFEITKDIYELQNNLYDGKKKYQIEYLRKTGDTSGYRQALEEWITFCKAFLDSYEGTQNFDYSNLQDAKDYEKLDEFYKDVDSQNYSVNFEQVSEKLIEDLTNEGALLLFQIYNKDFSEKSTGKKSLFTHYWLAMFSEENLKEKVIKLNGQAEIFFRPAQIKNKKGHRKDSILVNKFDNDDKPIPNTIYMELNEYLNQNKSLDQLSSDAKKMIASNAFEYRKATHDIIKNRRYTEDQMFFHVPITFNWSSNEEERLNDKVRRHLSIKEEQYIIGIDRGERHLLYYSVIDSAGRIVEQGSLNSIEQERHNGSNVMIPYNQMLTNKERERAQARIKWQSIEKIKDLKDGYLSHVVHFLSKLIVKYNAIIVLENLNQGFKRGRFKVERQVYQKFEMALMNKLSLLISKDNDMNELGGVLRPLQLCDPVEAYENLKGQNGYLFYLPAAYTSIVDPTTGFLNLFNFNAMKRKDYNEFFSNFQSLIAEKDDFVFTFDYSDFSNKKFVRFTNLNLRLWQASTRESRISYNRRKKEVFLAYPSEIIRESLLKHGVSYIEGENILKKIKDLDITTREAIYHDLLSALKFTLQLRNSDRDDGQLKTDYIVSPIKNSKDEYFDSRKSEADLPDNGDANGAYHVARKGLVFINKIKNMDDKETPYTVSNVEWINYLFQEEEA